MMTKAQPATPLPWHYDSETVDVITESGEFIATSLQPDSGVATQWEYDDAAYIAHAANAYPKLVETIVQLAYSDMSAAVMRNRLRSILRELGEVSQ
jgi:hypothetical protein